MSKPIRIVRPAPKIPKGLCVLLVEFDDGYRAPVYFGRPEGDWGWRTHSIADNEEACVQAVQQLIDVFPELLSKAVDLYGDLLSKKLAGAYIHVWPEEY